MRAKGHLLAAGALAACLALIGPAAAETLTGAAPRGDVVVDVTGLRNGKGQILACLAPDRKAFPDCTKGDGRALKIPVSSNMHIRFTDVPAGTYAIALLHDENSNGRIDKALMIPREGFGFSRDAPVRMGPPGFGAAAFLVGSDGAHQSIHMRYMM